MKVKTKILLILLVAISTVNLSAQRTVRIGYVDMEYILENVEEYREANEQLVNRVQKWKSELEKEKAEIDRMKADLRAEKVLLTDELIGEREEEIQILEKEMLDYQQNRFGPQGDLVLQKQRLIQPIQDQVFNEVQKIGANKKYDFIFDKSADVVMLYSEKRHDISDLILRGISRTRKISAPDKKGARNVLDDFGDDDDEGDVEISDAIRERQEKAIQAEDARNKTAEENRAEQLRIREERKKAYEERRKQLLEEREAKRQKDLEMRKNKKGSQDDGETKGDN